MIVKIPGKLSFYPGCKSFNPACISIYLTAILTPSGEELILIPFNHLIPMEVLMNYLETIYPLSPFLREHLSTIVKVCEIPKKEFLLKAGHVCGQVYFIGEGLLRCFYTWQENEVCSWFMKEGDVIISVESFFRQMKSKESIQAIDDSLLYYITYDELQFMYRNFPEFNFIGRVITEKYYTLSEQRLNGMRMQRSYERYAYFLQHHPELVKRVPSKYIASYLGITEVTLSNIKSRI